MDDLFLLIVLASLGALVVGVINPSAVVFWSNKKSRGKAVLGYLAIAVVCFVGFGLTHDGKRAGSTQVTTATGSGPTRDVAALAPASSWEDIRPDQQIRFVATVHQHIPQYKNASNELKKSSIKKKRDQATNQILGGSSVRDWVGILTDMGTNGDGNAYISISIGDNVSVMTWNNVLSDIGSGTLIENGSMLFDRIAELEEGNTVSFSGRLLSESSMTELGGMTDPEYIFKFTDVRRNEAGK